MLTLLTSAILYGQEVPMDTAVLRTLQPNPDATTFSEQFQLQDTIPANSTPAVVDSISMSNSIAVSDSLQADSSGVRSGMGNAIETQVDYDASDSLIFSMDGGTVELYNNAIITYGNIKLEAGYIRYEMQKSEVIANGIPDSTGEMSQLPIFSEGEDSYEAKKIRYNFKSKRGFIEEVITEQEGGYLHSRETKLQTNGHIHMKDGKFTTCDAEHPHFYLAITKGISMPDDKIVAGPAYLVVEDVPLPIGVPFGFFPNTKKKSSGILIPNWGEEQRRGFYLRDGGYYFALNDYFDLRLTGDVFSNGTWGLRAGSNYRVRYKFNGRVGLQFFNNITGYRNVEGASVSKDYSINWSHAQAREANPNRTFRASVNLSTSSYDRNHSNNINNAVTNTKQSSISYTKNWPTSPFNLSASLNHSQNSRTEQVNMTLPKVSFNMSRINPFERRRGVGPKKWYEDIQLSYSSILENKIKTADTLLFTRNVFNDMNNGFRHEVPISLPVKPFRRIAALQSFTLSPNISYKGMLYTTQTEKNVVYTDTVDADGEPITITSIQESIVDRWSYAHSYLPRVSASVAPKLFGLYQFTGPGRLEAIRHVATTSASFSYVPDMTAIQPNYYRELRDTNDVLLEEYSIYENQLYGTPTFNGASGSVSLSLKNNLEAKVRSRNDTIDEVEKVKLLDNLNFSTSYNIFNRDSLAPSWAPITMNGNTRLFKSKLNVNFRGTLDPFGYDDSRTRTTQTWFEQSGGKLARLTAASITMGYSFSSKTRSGDEKEDRDQLDPNLMDSPLGNSGLNDPNMFNDPMRDDLYGQYVDFDVPWSLRLDYSFSYRNIKNDPSIVQTVRFSGDISITPKWKLTASSGYDLENRQFTTTNMSIYRDLHCWEMRITVVPFGTYKSYNFQINAKSNILSDLKYNKRKTWQDNF